MKNKLLILALSVMTLLVSIQLLLPWEASAVAVPSRDKEPGLAAAGNTDEVVFQPNDDVLLMMSYSQAKRKIESMENRRLPVPHGTLIKDIKISSDKVTWKYPEFRWSETSYFKSMKIRVVHSTYGTFRVMPGVVKDEGYWLGGNFTRGEGDYPFWDALNKDEAVSLADAFYVLKRYAEGYKPEDELAAAAAFANEAKKYREIPVKPALQEDVQRYRVAAEDAYKNKDFEKALEYYKKGLAIEPLWPQGQFNAAMLAGELHWYNWAALHMKRYLELVPDAANAKAAREKMYLWEVKAKEALK
jgi:hypothetical protein